MRVCHYWVRQGSLSSVVSIAGAVREGAGVNAFF